MGENTDTEYEEEALKISLTLVGMRQYCNYEIKIQFIFLMEAAVIESNFFFQN